VNSCGTDTDTRAIAVVGCALKLLYPSFRAMADRPTSPGLSSGRRTQTRHALIRDFKNRLAA
jgi:hypothetical protein